MENRGVDAVLGSSRNIVLLGETGSGKSEIALNLAEQLAGAGHAVELFDLDQSKPLYRSRDAQDMLKEYNVKLCYEEQHLDTPVITGGVGVSLADKYRYTILDIGGNDVGAKMIGRFRKQIEMTDTKVLYIINAFRPWTRDADSVEVTMASIIRATRLTDFEFIANPNVGIETTAEDFLMGLAETKKLLPPGYRLQAACTAEKLYEDVIDKVDIHLMPLKIKLAYEWLQ